MRPGRGSREGGGPARRASGFTLVETMVAMLLVSAVALPAGLWLYRSRTHHAAWERFQATQALEMGLNRACLLRRAKAQDAPAERPDGLRLEIRMVDGDGGERRLLGVARNRRGRVVVDLEASLFERGGP